MFKLGVYRLDQFRQGGDGWYSKLSRNRVSYHLLRATTPSSQEHIALFESVMKHMRLSSGIFRTTYRGRLHDLDCFVNQLLVDRFEHDSPLRIHDWAASDCLTSCEWFRTLQNLFPHTHLTASDLTLFLLEATRAGKGAFVFERDGHLVQYIRPPFVIRAQPPEPWMLPVNAFLHRRAVKEFNRLKAGWNIPAEWLDSTRQEYRMPDCVIRKISLVHPEALALQESCERFRITKHSVFESLKCPAHVIRTMNILFPGYFSRERLAAGVLSVFESLVPGGLWIVGRALSGNSPVQHVSVFQRHTSGFSLVDRHNQGSDIEDLVASVCAADAVSSM